jgi:tRNA G18 (ribose-2'-O)-methylase SpoU
MNEDDETTVKTYFNVHDNLKHLSLDELKKITSNDRLPYSVATFNVNGNLNIGIMIRNAVLMGAERFLVFGKRQFDKRSCVGSHNYIDIDNAGGLDHHTKVFDFSVFWNTINKYNYHPIYIEIGGNAAPFDPFQDIISATLRTRGKKPCFIFGSESHGIPNELLDTAEDVLFLTQRGVIRSFNVSAAAAIVMSSVMNNFQR